MGRPAYIDDPDLVERVLDALRSGASRRDACEGSGVSYAWFKSAQRISREGTDPRYATFLTRVKEAQSHAVLVHTRNLQRNAEKGDNVASIFMLKALRPDQFNRPARQVLDVRGGASNALSGLEALPREQQIALIRAYLQRLEGEPVSPATPELTAS